MDSILGRTLVTDDRVELRDPLCRYFCMESRERVFQRARTALCAVVPPEEVEAQLEQLGSLHRYTPVNSAEVREAVVPAVLEAGGYRSEERRVGKSVDLGGRRIIKKKKKKREEEGMCWKTRA